MTASEPILVTGLGIVSAIGQDIGQFGLALQNSVSGIRPLSIDLRKKYCLEVAARVNLPPKRQIPRAYTFLFHSVYQALNQSRLLGSHDLRNAALFLCAPNLINTELEDLYRDYLTSRQVQCALSVFSEFHSYADCLAQTFQILGPRHTVNTACASIGLCAALAKDCIDAGEAEIAIVGGVDGFSESTTVGFHLLQNVSSEPCKPFDQNRSGLSFGEGSGIFVLERASSASKRNAPVFCQMPGVGLANEVGSLTAPDPNGFGFAQVMEEAVAKANQDITDVKYVNAHGTATLVNDHAEATAISRVFKNNIELRVSSIKGAIGHCMSAAGALECVATILSVKEDWIPGNVGLTQLDPQFEIHVPIQTIRTEVPSAICNNAGFGGSYSSVLFSKPEKE